MTGIVTWKCVLPANAVHTEGAAAVTDCCWCCSLVVHRHTKESLNPFLSARSLPVCSTSDGALAKPFYVLNKIIPTMFLNHSHLPIWSAQYIWRQWQSFSCLLQSDSHLPAYHMVPLAMWFQSLVSAYTMSLASHFASVTSYDIQLKFWLFVHLKMQQQSDRWMFPACLETKNSLRLFREEDCAHTIKRKFKKRF